VNPLLLAVDTTHEFGSLALARGEQILEEVSLHAPGGFAHILYGHLEQLLHKHGVSLDQIECFAAASGPGSFTGVRVGLACIKGLAEASGKPALAVSNLRALAWFGTALRRAVVLDARRGEVYAAVYASSGEVMVPETVAAPAAWLSALPDWELEFISTDFTPFCEAFAGTRFENARRTLAPRNLARAVARIACGRFQAGAAQDPAALDANYVRRSDAELFWKD